MAIGSTDATYGTATLNWHGDVSAGGYEIYSTRSTQLNWTLAGATPITKYGVENLRIGEECIFGLLSIF